MKASCYMVVARGKRGVIVRRTTTRRPWLDGDEAVIELELDLPDDVFDAPAFTVEVQKRHVVVGVEPKDARP